MTSKNPGMPTLVDTCSAAPASEAFLTVHWIFGALSLVMMDPVFSKRRRGALRFSFMAYTTPESA
jgi:hypothetical protein